MTLDELIQKTQGQSLPVSDDNSKKELRNLNKSIQELIGSMRKDKESTSTDTMKTRMRDMIDRAISTKTNGIKPTAPRLLGTTSKITKKEEAPKVDAKLVDTISKSNTSLLDEIKRMRADIFGLKNLLAKPQQEKLLAGSIDPNLSKGQRFDRGMSVPGGGGGGGGRSILGGLLGGAAAALAIGMTLSDEEKQKLKEMATSAGRKILEFFTDVVGTEIKKFLKDPLKYIEDNPGKSAIAAALTAAVAGPAILGATAAAAVGVAGYAGRKIIGGAGKIIGGAVGAAAGAGKYVLDKTKEAGTAVGKRIREGISGKTPDEGPDKKPKPEAKPRPNAQKIEPTMGDMDKKPSVEAEKKPAQKVTPVETEEQRAARERATQRAKDDAKAMGEADTEKRTRKVPVDDVKSKKKPRFLDKLKTGGKALLKGARFLGPVGAAIGVGMTAYEGVQAATNAEDVLGIEGRDATFTERLAAGVGGLAEGATLGLVSKEDVAKKLAGREENRSTSRDKVAAAIDRKARQAKTEREISREISMKRLQLEKMAGRDGKVSKSDLPEARQLASDIADLNADLRRVRAMPQEQRTYQPSAMLKDASSENRQLTLPAANMAPSPYGHMMQNIQNVFNSSNQTTVSGSAATPKNQSGTIARYLDRLFNAG